MVVNSNLWTLHQTLEHLAEMFCEIDCSMKYNQMSIVISIVKLLAFKDACMTFQTFDLWISFCPPPGKSFITKFLYVFSFHYLIIYIVIHGWRTTNWWKGQLFLIALYSWIWLVSTKKSLITLLINLKNLIIVSENILIFRTFKFKN